MLRNGSDSISKLKKGDVLLILLALLLAGASLLFVNLSSKDGAKVEIRVDKQFYGSYSLSEDREIEIYDDQNVVTNLLKIEDGQAKMISADCPDQICVNHSPIRKRGENIICLPHKVVVTVLMEEIYEEDVDAIVQ